MDTVETSLSYDHLYDIEDRKNATQLSLNKNRTPVSIKWSKLTYSVQIPDPNAGKKWYAFFASTVLYISEHSSVMSMIFDTD